MTDPDFSHLADQHRLDGESIPSAVTAACGDRELELVWRNDLGGLTFRAGDRFIKWNPLSTGIDLTLERNRLAWLAPRHPVPAVIDWGEDCTAQWMITAALDGDCAVGDTWRARRPAAIHAIATGLRAIHSVPIDDFPDQWMSEGWVGKRPDHLGTAPAVDHLVLVHGDACAPNTLIDDAGNWVGHVDHGDLSVGDRWADLAIASLSLDWNFGEGHQEELFDAYGVEPDDTRITYYRELWHAES